MLYASIKNRIGCARLGVGDCTFLGKGVQTKLSVVLLCDGGEAVESGQVEVGVVAEIGVAAGDRLIDFKRAERLVSIVYLRYDQNEI